ncbi:MAG TPA: condensation domain-containing protein, partial [Ktedonobacteraceae bacterium]
MMSDLPAQAGALSQQKRELLKERLRQKGINIQDGQIIPRREKSSPCALSFAQQRLWFLDQLEAGTSVYTIPTAIRLLGTLEVAALERSINEIVRRHETLRTTFATVDEAPAQMIAPALAISLPLVDLRFLPAFQHEKVFQSLAHQEYSQPFDLAAGPLLRAHLLRVNSNEHILLLTIHHIACDGWSLGILVSELSLFYLALTSGQARSLPPLPIQYADFALWQREWLSGAEMETRLTYWRQQLAGAPAALDLPADHPRPLIRTSRGAHYLFKLPGPLSAALAALSKQQGTTLFMTLLAAFAVLLRRYSGQDDLVIGTPIANRRHSELAGLIGCFANTLALRTSPAETLRFTDFLQHVREVCLQAYAHQDLPFEKLVEELSPERTLSHAPLFQVMFELQNASSAVLDLPGLQLQKLTIESGTAKFDLLLSVGETAQGLEAALEYSADLFEEATIRRMATHWQNLLTAIVHDPARQLADFPLLSSDEREQQFIAWNGSDQPYPYDLAFSRLFEAQVERTPEAIAVSYAEEHLTYQELNRRANCLATSLRGLGVGPEVLVALLGERTSDFLLAILAIFKAGGAYLPLDPLHPPERLHQVLGRSGCTLLLVGDGIAAADLQELRHLLADSPPAVLSLASLLRQPAAEANLPLRQTARHLAYVIYTSGSTGVPKGVMVEQRGMINHLYAKISDLHLSETDTVAQTASQCFDISVWQFLAILLAGGRVQIYPDAVIHDLTQFLPQIEQHRITILETVPSFLRAMVEAIETGGMNHAHLAYLRRMIPTGEALPPQLCAR